jgi:hypothetical protein
LHHGARELNAAIGGLHHASRGFYVATREGEEKIGGFRVANAGP